jgi:hypothetical protein
MRAPLRLWQALERIPGLAAVTQEWRSLLGDEYELVEAFLRPNGKLATGYPCPEPEGCGCVHAVVEHAPDDIVAVCRCTPRRCEAIPLRRQDIVVYELNRSALGASIASALQITQDEKASVDGLPMTSQIGTYSPYAGFRFPVYLTIQMEPDEFERVVDGLLCRNDKPFILLIPTRDLCPPALGRRIEARNSALIVLSEDFAFRDKSGLCLKRSPDEILARFRAVNLPSPKADGSMVFFPTPDGITWADVRIKFYDGHTVTIWAGEKTGRYNYTQMGMANRRNGNPTKQWELLRVFAEGRGRLDWSSSAAHDRWKKQKELLSKRLCEFFRLDDDPIEWEKDGKAYRCRFRIIPEGDDEY